MEIKAVGKYIKVQPRKVRIVADEVRGKSAVHTAHLLRFHPSKSARLLRKVLVSAIHNAVNNNGLSVEALTIAKITIDEGPRQKRIRARAMGRANRIIKKTSHITVFVEESDAVVAVKPHGTKAKPRPTFAAPTKTKRGGKKKDAAISDEPVMAAVADEPEEATPVTASEAPEEQGSAEPEVAEEPTPEADSSDDEKRGAE